MNKISPDHSVSKSYRDERAAKISATFKSKRIDNFARWREEARISGLIPDTSREFAQTTDLAYLVGLTLGDGTITKYARTEELRITLGTDKPALWKYSAKVVEAIFQKKPTVRKAKSEAMIISLYQNDISRRLEVPTGARVLLKISIPDWIWADRDLLIACLKGLYEAEGCFCIHEPTYTYNLIFSNHNISLLDEVEKALGILGFHPERRTDAVRLRKKYEALAFERLISFRKYGIIARAQELSS